MYIVSFCIRIMDFKVLLTFIHITDIQIVLKVVILILRLKV